MTLPTDVRDKETGKFVEDNSSQVAVRVRISDIISDIDLVNNPATVWAITRPDGQPDTETITLASGDQYRRTFTYTGNLLTARSKWVKL